MPPKLNFGTLLVTAALGLGFVCASGCRSPKRPERPHEPPETVRRLSDEKELLPYLEGYPLGDRGTRIDLLGRNSERSLHFLQTTQVVPAHTHPQVTVRAYVLTGQGTVYIGDSSYPAVPGSAFRIEPGAVHSIHPDVGETLVAILFCEPPQGDQIERILAPD